MSNVVEITRQPLAEVKYTTIKQFEPVEDGTFIRIDRGSGNGIETYAIVIELGPEGSEPADLIGEYEATDGMLTVVEALAMIADKTLARYFMALPDDLRQKQISSAAVEAEQLKHRRRIAQSDLNTLRSADAVVGQDIIAATEALNKAKADEAKAERELRSLICLHDYEVANEKRIVAGLDSLTADERDSYIEGRETYARAFG